MKFSYRFRVLDLWMSHGGAYVCSPVPRSRGTEVLSELQPLLLSHIKNLIKPFRLLRGIELQTSTIIAVPKQSCFAGLWIAPGGSPALWIDNEYRMADLGLTFWIRTLINPHSVLDFKWIMTLQHDQLWSARGLTPLWISTEWRSAWVCCCSVSPVFSHTLWWENRAKRDHCSFQ